MMKRFAPKKVYVEKAAADFPRARRILANFTQPDIVLINDHRALDFASLPAQERFREAKQYLALAVKQGAMVKEFRRHASLRQDVEYYLLHAANCPFDCSYCYLQCYFDNAVPTLFVNLDVLFEQVDVIVKEQPDADLLFHAGETADALALELYSGFAGEAIDVFAKFKKATLELRTKSDLIEPLLSLQHRGRAVVSWTLTPNEIAEKYEAGAASIPQRLQAASTCLSAGYPIGLRFDPIIHHNGWRKNYEALIEEVFDALPPEGIDSVVLGTFRFPPRLLDVMRERFGRNELVLGEFVPAPDGKMRYFRHIRQEMYRELAELFKRRCGPSILPKIELAMEPDYIWSSVF